MDLEFIQTKTNDWVPVINGSLLHSSVDPLREARDFIDREWARIEDVKSIIVFGLGGGFHIQELLKRKDFNVVVIEAEKSLAAVVTEKYPDIAEQVSILAGVPPSHICGDKSVTDALSHSYAILKHPVSLRISPFYYTAVIQMLNERTLARLKQLSQGNRNLYQFFDSLNISTEQILTLPMVEEAMARRGTGLDKEGLIWMAMRELIV